MTDRSAEAQRMITDEAFNDFLCQEVAKTLGVIGQGTRKDLMPTLVVVEPIRDEIHPFTVMALTIEDFNDNEARRKALQKAGKSAWVDCHLVLVAVFLCTEAWMRIADRGELLDKQVADYDDKQEAIVVQGKTLDGRVGMAQAIVKRDENDFIYTELPNLLPINATGVNEIQTPLLDSFLFGYSQAFMKERRKPKGFGG